MKKHLFIISTLLLFGADCFAAELTPPSKVTAVTVYPDRALVTRQARLDLEEGQNFIVFEGLPSALIEESLRGAGQGDAPVSILGVELKKTFGTDPSNPRVAQITSELEKLQGELKSIQVRQNALASQRLFLDSIRSFSSTQIPEDLMTKNIPASEIAPLSDYLLKAYEENGQKTLELEKEITDKNKAIQAKQQELYEIQSGQAIDKKSAVLTLKASAKTSFTAELSYLVPQASWSISHDAKVDTRKNSCTLISYGSVQQWTGEDWKNTKLTLSSAKPSVGGHMPELFPWYVDFLQVMPYAAEALGGSMARRTNKLMTMEAADSAQMAPASAPMESMMLAASLEEASVTQDLGSVSYDIQTPATALSDNRPYKFPVLSEDYQTSLDYESTPKLSPYAFIHSKVANSKDNPIPGGALNVFVNDNYVGQSSIPSVGRDESFDLYLGIDEEIKVKRTEISDKKNKSMLGLRARKDFAYKFEIENYKKEKIRLALLDQIPVSKNGDIRVSISASTPKPSETKDLGVLKWNFELEPREKKTHELRFSVEYPSDKPVTGV